MYQLNMIIDSIVKSKYKHIKYLITSYEKYIIIKHVNHTYYLYRREEIIQILQCAYYKSQKKNFPIFEVPEPNLKGFTTTEKDKKRATDRFPLNRFRNKAHDIY